MQLRKADRRPLAEMLRTNGPEQEKTAEAFHDGAEKDWWGNFEKEKKHTHKRRDDALAADVAERRMCLFRASRSEVTECIL